MQGTQQGKHPRLWGAVAATSLLYAAAHPPWSIWPAALVAVAPVAAVLLDRRAAIGWRRAALAGAAFGFATTWLIAGYWSFLAARQFLPQSLATPLAVTAALPLVAAAAALHYAIGFALAARLAGLGAAAGVIGSAALWTLAEIVRTSLGYGNPWGAFAAALTPIDVALSGMRAETPVADLLRVGGMPAVAFVATAIGSSLGLAWTERKSRVRRGRALAAGAIVVLACVGVASAARSFPLARGDDAIPNQPLRVALVQTGIAASRPWQSGGAADAFRRNLDLTGSLETRGADLIVWSEDSLPFLLDANVERRQVLRELARVHHAALLLGGSHSVAAGDGVARVYNSAILFPADGSEPQIYDKGTGPVLFRVKDWVIAPLICLEAIYPGAAAARAGEGADLLINISNDSWFDEGAGSEQHFRLAMLRAAETSRPLVRVATTGVSALVGADGLVSWRLPVHSAGVALLDVIPPREDSLYVRGGRSGFVLIVVVLSAAAAILPGRARRNRDRYLSHEP